MTNHQIIMAEQLKLPLSRDEVILDVRTRMEHAEKRLKCPHELVPLDELEPTKFMTTHHLDKNTRLYLLCKGGKRAAQAAEKFMAAGYPNMIVIEGGIMACEICGHEVDGYAASQSKTTRPPSLERQVRICAGLLVMIGALLSLFINPLFGIIPLAVGSGLVFSGITDRCGMALFLAKAPWNVEIKA